MNLVDKIKFLCQKREITMAELERKLEFGNGTISKWVSAKPSVEKLLAVAKYFNVSSDYLLGMTEISTTPNDMIGDKRLVTIQRNYSEMSENQKETLLKISELAIQDAFAKGANDDTI